MKKTDLRDIRDKAKDVFARVCARAEHAVNLLAGQDNMNIIRELNAIGNEQDSPRAGF